MGSTEAHIYRNGKDVLRAQLHHQDTLTVGPYAFNHRHQATSKTRSRLDQLLEKMEEEADEQVYDFAQEDLFYLTTKDPSLRQRINFTIPSRDRFIDQAQAFLARIVRQSGMDEMKVEAFMTCTKELILNAHRHGHEYDESAPSPFPTATLMTPFNWSSKTKAMALTTQKSLAKSRALTPPAPPAPATKAVALAASASK